jgi:hypothetical protein
MLLYLSKILNLELRSDIYPKEQSHSLQSIRDYLLHSSSSHLFILYPSLCKLLKVVSGFSVLSNSVGDGLVRMSEEAQMVEDILDCLGRLGTFFTPIQNQ